MIKQRKEEMKKKCAHCKEPIEDWASGNEDGEGNEYCMNCVSEIEHIMEMEEYDKSK